MVKEIKEMWIAIKDFKGLYSASTKGNIRSDRTYRILKPQNSHGYKFVILSKNNIKRKISVHRIIAKTFIKNNENKKFVNHIDGNKTNNSVENLEWVTVAENIQHSYYVLKNKIKSIVCIETGKIYNSLREAERITGIKTGGISRSCKNNYYKAGGYTWRYVN